ncbi:hypothetical protein [Aeromonas media]|uniref:hypothetical protein n=1 Tax=Aeromonas media TaxID=651 RepID=UPI0022801B31|nr:hypothetical protein [Aeromonas media]MCY9824124.1 hypothetical protein [Aeromonas media]
MSIFISADSLSWTGVAQAAVPMRVEKFRQAQKVIDPADVKSGLRPFAARLLADGLITMSDYVATLGGHALYHLTPQGAGCFVDMTSGEDAAPLAAIYSRAKHGGVEDIAWLAQRVVDYLSAELDRTDSPWLNLFIEAKEKGDNVAMMTTGWRNVPSTANVLYDIVVEEINVKLAHMELPTIVNVKLPRIAPPCENYASLSQQERNRVNLMQDHVIPAENFYRWSGVHVIFGDDVLVTGATADKVLYHSLQSGAKSFRAIYPVAIDPRVALGDAAVEDRLNGMDIIGELDDNVARLLSASGYQPILRMLRLLFGEENRQALAGFLPHVPDPVWLKLYRSALGNEFLRQPACRPSLQLLRGYLAQQGLLAVCGGGAQ